MLTRILQFLRMREFLIPKNAFLAAANPCYSLQQPIMEIILLNFYSRLVKLSFFTVEY